MKSLTTKIGISYLLLTILTIAFFSISTNLNHVELIETIIRTETNVVIERIYPPLELFLADYREERGKDFSQDDFLERLTRFLDELTDDNYSLYDEDGKLLYKRKGSEAFSRFELAYANSAIINKVNIDRPYEPHTYDDTNELYLYIPIVINELLDLDNSLESLDTSQLKNIVICLKMDIVDVDRYYNEQYRLIFIIIGVVLIIQVLFGFILYSIIIRPLKQLNSKTQKLREGDLSSRVKVRRKDEIGQLGFSFNSMADSIEEKITQLEEKNKIMQFELEAAGKVQQGIYPLVENTELFDLAIHHRPLYTVSGDYHDVFDLGEGRYGFLVADVSGHGVPAALVTMKIKDVFNQYVNLYPDTRELFIKVNTELADLMDTFSCFFTAFYCVIDSEQKISYSTAGHPVAYLVRPSVNAVYNLLTDGFMIGITNDFNGEFKSKSGKLQPGDKIVIFSDGIIEAINEANEQYDYPGLLKAIGKYKGESCNSLKDSLVNDLNKHIGRTPRRDDETLMIIEIKGK